MGLIILILIIVLIIYVRARTKHERAQTKVIEKTVGEPSAIAILDKRYANGEINKEEYEERRKVLMSK